jgi:hypothetical protein
MAADDDPTLSQRKIFPRNLTARAATMVRGNPANARPESGVDNTHPGLEFDQRNLDKAFFPGLVFEFQFLHGARLVEVRPELFKPANDLQQSDVDGEIYLYYVFGAFGAQPAQPRLVELHRTDGRSDGYEVLRTVHDLEPGRIMVVIGAKDPSRLARLGPKGGQEFAAALDFPDQYVGTPAAPPPHPKIYRDPDTGKLLAAILFGDRADYLDANGVIAPAAAPPGGLTRSLCAPWQWDFADCGCHYWAANKPDIVIAADGKEQVLNFQRSRSKISSTGPDAKSDKPAAAYAEWITGEMTQPEMIRDWETLPFVIAERETDRARRHPIERDWWTRDKVIDELKYLATIEHALSIEYLYAFYSLDAPAQRPIPGEPHRTHDVFTAAQVVRSIAVDEMRHFRWANEALQLLGADICLDRAAEFKRRDNQISGKFELYGLTPDRLDFFIRVEAPSRSSGKPNNLDGLYTQLLNSLGNGAGDIDPAVRRRLAEIVKLIIDEGNEHWKRFEKVKKLLAPYRPETYLRVPGRPVVPPNDGSRANQHLSDLQSIADWNYRIVLEGIRQAFDDNPVNRAGHIADARATMYNLDDTGQELARRHFGMFFTIPKRPADTPDPNRVDERAQPQAIAQPPHLESKSDSVLQALADPDATGAALRSVTEALERLKISNEASVRQLALRHLSRIAEMAPAPRDEGAPDSLGRIDGDQ